MLKRLLAVSITLALVSGCNSTQNKVPTVPAVTNAELTAGLETTQANIIDTLTVQCEKPSEEVVALTKEVNALNDRVRRAVENAEKKSIIPVPVEATSCPESQIGDKFVLGEVEGVYVDEVKAKFPTRIDTGAESSSLDARNIVLFERNGAQWVRFDVMTNGEGQPGNTFESKVERFVRIKQDAESKDDRRPVIHAHLKIGKYSAETDLNLTDRSHLEYPLLLGRKFMKDIAVVDVSKRYIHGKITKTTEVKAK
ncbi:ATP-dependent zinc protease [Shewanella sp. WXL01]|uniref:ATP-dependent zinc protease n=1 Tax=Shewanella maritima TaxID=2520507 RepID=A0A411PMH3_9GAMM|nr:MULTISPECIES: ATP-dependent zinc protease [Shewanella]NKF52613.1 ATP-dependent zinc protease [Shewanella sp. WXL01]QBF84723.1 ATP-dependent zinc protease [Shewanella maritima]